MNYKKIHLTGIGGIAMGTLACMLRESGYDITGSDSGVYPPMSDILRDARIEYGPFSEDNAAAADLVIVGNAISRGNVEAEYVLNEKKPYLSMAGALHEFFLRDREVIAVCGTHGKTTTTALLAHILTVAGLDPSCFIGGNSINLGKNYRLGKGKYFIIEGDEYDSAFFEKVPKFIFYRPSHCILTSLEFDHADIYRDLDEISLWFKRLVNIIPSKGNIVYSSAYDTLRPVIAGSRSRCASFGSGGSDFTWHFSGYTEQGAALSLSSPGDGAELALESTLFGDFNYANIAGAAGMALKLGIAAEDIIEAVKTFRGVKRRQEIIYRGANLVIYEDFAHHPTAIGYMLRTLAHRHTGSKIWAIYEPRSATSRRNVFQNELPGAFEPAGAVLMKTLFNPGAIPPGERLDLDRVRADLETRGKDARLFGDVDAIIRYVADHIDFGEENIIIIMSNGGFDGIYHEISRVMGDLEVKSRN
ncbi:MAG: UDP-N-acetylmuramate:L-alanyl-gamma-D-glutamyl-meso-diaminopimelate ligase [Spirochaetae bacterium HGW-Spirochaetae-1]|jgi:UDP-N-acetylmuramate: L-alanyl-gamma-D-glutamyl-meso-diaminopimelate ligase|nr:MAG: UDP-N-acetylmuramate:L-alanyl-gamma-D-glutamyl-meso-diaminopimelate ligase [Spirochaetae bacterium HGW-Spirochaetae-1]